MSQSQELTSNSVPLLGICDIAMHRLRPVVVGINRSEAGRKEFEILMVCSRCGYARDARQLQRASEELATDVLLEINDQGRTESGNPGGDDDATDEGIDAEEDLTKTKPRRSPKKIN